MNDLKDGIIDWIKQNAEDIRYAAICLLIINLMILGLAACSGDFLWYFLHIPNILLSNASFSIPMVYIVKVIRNIQ